MVVLGAGKTSHVQTDWGIRTIHVVWIGLLFRGIRCTIYRLCQRERESERRRERERDRQTIRTSLGKDSNRTGVANVRDVHHGPWGDSAAAAGAGGQWQRRGERERKETKQIPGDGGSRGETEPWSATIESEIEIRGWEASKDSLLL